MFFNEDHLRITKIRTADGLSPVMGADERPLKKIIFAPSNPITRKSFEDLNSRLPTALKMKIEVVKGYNPQVVHNPEPATDAEKEAMKSELSELKAQMAEMKKMFAASLASPSSNGDHPGVEAKNEKPDESVNGIKAKAATVKTV